MQSERTADKEAATANLGAAELLAAISYMSDCALTGCTYHSWRVALVARKLAASLSPEEQFDVFYAGLLHDIGTVGAKKPMDQYPTLQAQLSDVHMRSHPDRGAALLERIPGMEGAARLIKLHHERWDGSGYPDAVSGDDIPMGAQVIRAADEAASAGCFVSGLRLAECLGQLARLTQKAWSRQLWEALVRSAADAGFYRALMSEDDLPAMISRTISELSLGEETLSEKSVERIYHVFAALTDAKDNSKAGHAIRVARTAHAVAAKMKLGEDECLTAYHAGLVHDCGWVAIPGGILPYSGRLSRHELDIVRRHAEFTIKILGCLPDRPAMAELGRLAGGHHEWLDGKGYPNHLSAGKLHTITRILSVADAFDGMVSASSYRILSVKGALSRLKEGVGAQFDAKAVAALAGLVERGELQDDTSLAA